MLRGKNRRQVVLSLTAGQRIALATRLTCGELLINIEDALYDETIGMNLREFKREVSKLIYEGGDDVMMYNKTVAGLIERAQRHGYAKTQKRLWHGQTYGYGGYQDDDSTVVYEVEYSEPEGFKRGFRLWHYGTMILQACGTEIEAWGGYSRSDSDALNTALQCLSIPGRFYIRKGELNYDGAL
jgi:hypothetical protein